MKSITVALIKMIKEERGSQLLKPSANKNAGKKERAKNLAKMGLCVVCAKKAVPNRLRCERCLDENKARCNEIHRLKKVLVGCNRCSRPRDNPKRLCCSECLKSLKGNATLILPPGN